MKRVVFTLVLACVACDAQDTPSTDVPDPRVAGWEQQAQNITIIRDDWGIPHIYGETDADAVFGMIYAQAEDDFNRIEVNFLNSQGRLAEAEGEAEIWRDLRHEAVHRSCGHASPVRCKPCMAQGPDGRVGGGPQLLPVHAPGGDT